MAEKKTNSSAKTNQKSKSATKKSTKKFNREYIYILIIAVLLVALLVTLFAGNVLKDILNGNSDNENPSNGIYNSVLSGVGNIVLPSEFDSDNCLEVHFINVGQGDAIVIMLPDGKNMFIDAGNSTRVNATIKENYFNYLSDNLNLKENDTIDYLLVTHPDSDHVNLMTDVLNKYDVDAIYYNDYSYNSSNTATYKNFTTAVKTEPDAKIYCVGAGSISYKIKGQGYTIDIYAPGYDNFYKEAYEGTNRNILSIMCVLSYGGRKVMFTGDAEIPTEEWFMNTVGGTLLDVDVLKVGHHGSSSCTSTAFLDYIKPEYAVISCDNGTAYQHPSATTMNTLFNYGIVTYRTNRHGNTVLYIDGDGDFGFLPQNYVDVENNTKNINPLTIKLQK